MYRIGLPFWRQLARAGVPLNIRVNVLRDDEAQVFVATSNDLRGLVCEATTMDELVAEINSSVNELLSLQLKRVGRPPVTDLRLCRA
jgi:sigma54-dependent transcription regulator